MNIGIIGNGFVGKATYLLKCQDINIKVYDINPKLCNPLGTTLTDLKDCEFIFISVPTPMNKDGSCYLNIVNDIITNLKVLEFKNFIILRSTVPIGTCDSLNCYFMPEFLTEKNFEYDFINNKDWIFGLTGDIKDKEFKLNINKLFDLAFLYNKIKYNNIHFITTKEAEMVKLFKNCFLANKVSFCNEMHQFCQIKNINYDNVIKIVGNDDRILHSHTKIPGPDGKYGFGGTCFPKDVASLKYEMEQCNMVPYILKSIITRNELIDRPEKDWCANKGRAVIE